MGGGAVPMGSSGLTLVNPSDEGDVVVVGTAASCPTRSVEKRSSFTMVGESVRVQAILKFWLLVESVNPDPTGTSPPVEAPLMISKGYASDSLSRMYVAD